MLKHTGWLVLLVLVGLLALHHLPWDSWRGHALRRVDILSDLRLPQEPAGTEEDASISSPHLADALSPDDADVPQPATEEHALSPTDTTLQAAAGDTSLPVEIPVLADTCREGLACIEDYGDTTMQGMKPFYEALCELEQHGDRTVRIAYFGDSFIEADILTADLRALLQEHFGGCGVGFVPITSQTYGYRRTVRHNFDGWHSHAVTDTVYFDRFKQGISGHYFVPTDGAYLQLRGQNKYASRLDTCRRASLLFYAADSLTLTARVNQGRVQRRSFPPSARLNEMTVEGAIGAVRWTVEEADTALFYGALMDGDSGIALDNFALRGSSGLSLRYIPDKMLRDFNRLRPYDLIVLQYGLNVATRRGVNYDRYAAGMRQTIQHLKTNFPQAGILIVGVGDRDYKAEDGTMRTMPGIRNLIRYQQTLAVTEGVAFWNLYEAMGGEGSMVKLVKANPPMANLDYTHINYRGGKHIAGLLFETLLYGKEQYERRRGYGME
ncbi:MAG: hypothetical protein IJ511_00170 [Bacteroides sp.]|nr:hypothetical protein [Bacteroides sp.]